MVTATIQHSTTNQQILSPKSYSSVTNALAKT